MSQLQVIFCTDIFIVTIKKQRRYYKTKMDKRHRERHFLFLQFDYFESLEKDFRWPKSLEVWGILDSFEESSILLVLKPLCIFFLLVIIILGEC